MIQENLDTFLADWGVPVSFGTLSATGILDMPGEIVLGDVLSNEYALTFKTSALPGLTNNSAIIVNHPAFGTTPTAFKVRDVRMKDDGAFSVAYLSKV